MWHMCRCEGVRVLRMCTNATEKVDVREVIYQAGGVYLVPLFPPLSLSPLSPCALVYAAAWVTSCFPRLDFSAQKSQTSFCLTFVE